MSSAFKLLWKTVLTTGKVPDKLKKPIKCFVKESSPYFLVTDDFFYVPCYFTKKAVDGFKGGKSLADMQGKVITISDWSLEMVKVKSDQVFTSYAGVEVRFVVNSVAVAASSSDSITLTRQPANIYRDAEIKSLINKLVWDAQVKGVAGAGLPDISKMSGKGNVANSIVKCGNSSVAGLKAPTATVAIKGSGKSAAAGKNVKPTVKGGVASKSKVAPKKAGKPASKIIGKSSAIGKKSRAGKGSIGKDLSGAGTTDARSMKQFRKLVAKHKKGKK